MNNMQQFFYDLVATQKGEFRCLSDATINSVHQPELGNAYHPELQMFVDEQLRPNFFAQSSAIPDVNFASFDRNAVLRSANEASLRSSTLPPEAQGTLQSNLFTPQSQKECPLSRTPCLAAHPRASPHTFLTKPFHLSFFTSNDLIYRHICDPK